MKGTSWPTSWLNSAIGYPDLEVSYNQISLSAVWGGLREKCTNAWEKSNGVPSRQQNNLKLTNNNPAMITGHGKLLEYAHCFKMIDDPICLCRKNSQSVDHILQKCELLQKREELCRKVIVSGGRWKPNNSETVQNI